MDPAHICESCCHSAMLQQTECCRWSPWQRAPPLSCFPPSTQFLWCLSGGMPMEVHSPRGAQAGDVGGVGAREPKDPLSQPTDEQSILCTMALNQTRSTALSCSPGTTPLKSTWDVLGFTTKSHLLENLSVSYKQGQLVSVPFLISAPDTAY